MKSNKKILKPSEFIKYSIDWEDVELPDQRRFKKELDERFIDRAEVEEIVDKYEAKIRELKQKLKSDKK